MEQEPQSSTSPQRSQSHRWEQGRSYTELMTCTVGHGVTRSQPAVEKHVIAQEESQSSEPAQVPRFWRCWLTTGPLLLRGYAVLRAPFSLHSPQQSPQGGQAPPVETQQRQGWVRDPPRNPRSHLPQSLLWGDTRPQPMTYLLSSAASGSWRPLRVEKA